MLHDKFYVPMSLFFHVLFLTGFASKKFSEIFSKAFLIPLDESDNFFRLEVGPQIMHSLHEKKKLIWAKNVNNIMAQASSNSGRFYEADMKNWKVLYVKSLVVNTSARTMGLIACVNIHANFWIKCQNDIGCTGICTIWIPSIWLGRKCPKFYCFKEAGWSTNKITLQIYLKILEF